MRKLSVVALVVLSSGAGFWLGHTRAAQRSGTTTRPGVTGNINVVGDSFRNAVLSSGIAVGGDLRMRSLPDGNVELAGNLLVRPN